MLANSLNAAINHIRDSFMGQNIKLIKREEVGAENCAVGRRRSLTADKYTNIQISRVEKCHSNDLLFAL